MLGGEHGRRSECDWGASVVGATGVVGLAILVEETRIALESECRL